MDIRWCTQKGISKIIVLSANWRTLTCIHDALIMIQMKIASEIKCKISTSPHNSYKPLVHSVFPFLFLSYREKWYRSHKYAILDTNYYNMHHM